MKIIDLDGFALNPGDLSFDGFREIGEFENYDRTEACDIVERVGNAEAILVNKTPLRRETLEKLPSLKYIGVLATGYDVVDINYARERGITVTNIPGYGTEAVAQLTFALILEIYSKVAIHDASVKAGEWTNCKDFSYFKASLNELSGKTIGIFGFGEIGQKVAMVANAFNMKVLVYSRTKKITSCDGFVTLVSKEELFKNSDIISLHCPLNEETNLIINNENIKLMKRTAILINTARGKLINETHLAEALDNDLIAGVAVDVLSTEPPTVDNPMLKAKNTIITPHIAWGAREARDRLINIAINNLKAFLSGEPINVVSK